MGGYGSCSDTLSRGMTKVPITASAAFSPSLLSAEGRLEELRALTPRTTTKVFPASRFPPCTYARLTATGDWALPPLVMIIRRS